MSWQVGDLAVCVDGTIFPGQRADLSPVRGKIYRVLAVYPESEWLYDKTGVGLLVSGCFNTGNDDGQFWHGRFRKIEPAEPVFVEAMRNLRTPVDA